MHEQSQESMMLHELSGKVEALTAMVVALSRSTAPDRHALLASEINAQVRRKLEFDVSEQGAEQNGGFADVISEIRTTVPFAESGSAR